MPSEEHVYRLSYKTRVRGLWAPKWAAILSAFMPRPLQAKAVVAAARLVKVEVSVAGGPWKAQRIEVAYNPTSNTVTVPADADDA